MSRDLGDWFGLAEVVNANVICCSGLTIKKKAALYAYYIVYLIRSHENNGDIMDLSHLNSTCDR